MKLRLSFRLPPNLDPETVKEFTKNELERDPPYKAKVTAKINCAGKGFCSKPLSKDF